MKLVYIAGPFRDKPDAFRPRYSFWQQERNIRRAEEVALQCWRMGFSVICPHTNTRNFQGELDDNVWLKGDLEQIKRSDFLVLVPGWESSVGTRNELAFARENGLRVFVWDDELIDAAEIGSDGVRYKGIWLSNQVAR